MAYVITKGRTKDASFVDVYFVDCIIRKPSLAPCR